ncbi:conjugal transfer protein TraH [Pantoea cypripedii]|uniref:Conjugal transfer protein TraH n=1 Tax=Pantoea cypripedii TaxID=55209 RepID=A0A6B9GGT6_PANCY|nr:conjugal transfer protein TraH [Pantoea cypripedii]QGY32526.1 conjugal transfer protein TraH [Pantoea cypripedii]
MQRPGNAAILLVGLFLTVPALADVSSDIRRFFNDMGGGNYTQAAAWQGQSAGYLTGGNLFIRTPVRNIQLISVTLPDIKSGCGGIDAYLGSFSFINSDSIKIMGKQILSNAAGYAFDLGLETICPQCKSVKDYLQKLAADTNNMNISTCQAAQSIVGGLWPKTQAANAQICQDLGTKHDVFSDWAASRQGCGVGGQTDSVFSKATDEERQRIPRNRNLTWESFSKLNQFFSSDRLLKEFLMSMVGTVIYDGIGNPTFLQPRGGSESMFNTLLNGGSEKIYRCNDNDTCLSPVVVSMTLAESDGMTGQVRNMLNDIFDKSRSDMALSENERALISSTRVRILRYTIDSASVGLDQSVVSSLAEYIAADMVMSYINGLIDVAASGAAGTLDTEAENQHFRENLRQVRNELSQRVARIQVQQNGLAEYDRSLRDIRQQLSTSLSDQVMSNYEFGG